MIQTRLDELVLARVATRAEPFSRSELAGSLRRCAPPTLDSSSWERAIVDAATRLRDAGEIDPDGTVPHMRTVASRWGGTGKLRWPHIVERAIPGLALGVPVDDVHSHRRLVGRDAWAAAIVGRSLGIWRDGPPLSLTALCDALVWLGVGLAGAPKRTPPELRAHFVARALDLHALPAERAVRVAAAARVDAPRADLRALREALVRRWLVGASLDPESRSAAVDEHEVRRLAAAVHAISTRLVRHTRDGRKILIADVMRELRLESEFRSLPRSVLETRLVEAHKAGLIALSRADLVASIDPVALRESEVAHLDARYHFVEREAP